MRHLTVRNIPADLASALDRARKQGGHSLNSTVVALLRKALGLEPGKRFSNGLAKYAGGWSEKEFREFERNTAFLRQIDEDMWK